MADNNELQTSRLSSGGPGSYVDNDMADLEAAIRTIFKVTADSDLSAVASIGTGPDMTLLGTLTLAGDPTEDLHACTKQYADNTQGIAAPLRCTLVLSGGQTVNNGNTDALGWDAAHIEQGGDCWAGGNPTRIVAPAAGDYILTGCIQGKGAGGTDADFHVKVKLNGTTWLYDLLAIGYNDCGAGSYEAGAPFAIMEPMDPDDYLEVFVYAFNNNQEIAVDSMVSWFKVG
ncbi:MAG: hypothetical protein ACYSUC_06895 [Planctomycetota bacterium]|jgi:hypothetical protein